jgi:hypothetical protein
MANKWTRSAVFRFYNAHPRNFNWSSSGFILELRCDG